MSSGLVGTRRTPYIPSCILPAHLEDGWVEQAACKGADQALFFPTGESTQRDMDEVGTYCGPCPVRGQCLLFALIYEHDDWTRSGIFGGMTPPQRARYRQRLRWGGRHIAPVRVRSPRGRYIV